MAEVSFDIQTNKKAYRSIIPIYTLGSSQPIEVLSGRSEEESCTVVRFADGTVIDKINDLFMIGEYCFSSLDDTFQVLPEDVVETILFNIDVFRRL